jgi:DNA-binding response OmpR family regulator
MEEKKRILIVDDEAELVEMLTTRFEAAGYEVDCAFNGQECLEHVRNKRPDIILLDIMMPKLDGLHVCRLLKFNEEYQEIPIVILTARGQESDKTSGEKVGADFYIVKPFDSGNLVETVDRLVHKG